MADDIWVFDCEGDGLTPSKMYCLAAACPQAGEVSVTSDYDNMRKLLKKAKVLIGHNIIRWDIPQLERILGIKIKAKLVDTLAISWYLYPDRHQHGLEGWGVDLGVPKPVIIDWFSLSQEEYEHRCKEDVKINVLLWKKMYEYLVHLYGTDKEIWKLLDYLTLKMHCAMLQERSRWKLDIGYTQEALDELTAIQEEKKQALIAAMPRVPVIQEKSRPKRFINAAGDYTKLGMEWVKLLTEKGLPVSYDGTVEIVKGYEEGNPGSHQQLKDWLFFLGWKPETYKEVKNKTTGEIKRNPQINLEQGKGICPSIKRLYEKEPALELLDGLSVLQHRIGILKGFLRDSEDGYIKAQISGLTNTLRFQHTTVVNLPRAERLYAKAIRGSLIADEGMELCGSDMSSLEDRIKQHFIYPYDPEYVKEMMTDDYDPHLSLALSASAVTIEQVTNYKAGIDKSIKPIRDIFKNGNYACQYGAGAPRLAVTADIPLEEAKKVHAAYWKKNWAIKAVADAQKVKTVNDQMWLYNPISGLWYSLRFEKDVFSTLVQGTASYVFDLWVEEILKDREQLTGQFHDEIIICVKEGYSKYNEETRKWEGPIVDFLKEAIRKTNEKLKLNRELDIDVQFGKRYSDIH